ncbi:angiotensin-converting enzyme-like [Episyrphus balteatus]|uniref:angiotensin-converting enzyme-like n=1 Tax=Episyrphus balteatus TaxID=286459 RepID=UPI00248581E0|nr:angiotensin-converting enzyme-like [Episyrphus balteatus]
MERIFIYLAVFGILLIALCHSAPLNSNEAEAKKFLNQTSDKLFHLFDDNAKRAYSKNSDESNSYDVREENINFSKVLKSIVENARKFDFKNFKDKELQYAFEEVVKVADDKIIGPEKFLEIHDSLEEFDNITKHKNTQVYGDKSSKKVALNHYYQKIFERCDDPMELHFYWIALRTLTGEWAKDNLDKTINGLKEAAKLSEMTPLEFWLRGFNMTDMEKFVEETRPLYLELHAFLRNQLKKKYGESVILPDGLIQAHVMDQIQYQILTNKSIIEDMFPYENLPSFDTIIKDKFTAKEIYEIAEKFYENLGFEKYPASFWGDRIRMYTSDDDDYVDEDESDEKDENDQNKQNVQTEHSENDESGGNDNEDEDEHDDEDDECSPRNHHFTPNIYLEFCEKIDYHGFLNAYADMGYIYYAKEMKDLPTYFFNYPHYLEYTIGNAVMLSASSTHNLKAIGMLPNTKIITPEVEINALLRNAIGTLVYIPLNFVNTKVMADLLTGNVKMADLNKHYWHLMEKYAGIGTPEFHESDTLDLSSDFYTEMNDNLMSSDLTNGMLSYQIYKRLCEISGKYPKEPLHLCDISGSKDAGNALKKMMRLGVSKPFYKVLATMFPENPTIRTEGILEYYAPIKNLITEKNKEANVKIGWKSSSS